MSVTFPGCVQHHWNTKDDEREANIDRRRFREPGEDVFDTKKVKYFGAKANRFLRRFFFLPNTILIHKQQIIELR